MIYRSSRRSRDVWISFAKWGLLNNRLISLFHAQLILLPGLPNIHRLRLNENAVMKSTPRAVPHKSCSQANLSWLGDFEEFLSSLEIFPFWGTPFLLFLNLIIIYENNLLQINRYWWQLSYSLLFVFHDGDLVIFTNFIFAKCVPFLLQAG